MTVHTTGRQGNLLSIPLSLDSASRALDTTTMPNTYHSAGVQSGPMVQPLSIYMTAVGGAKGFKNEVSIELAKYRTSPHRPPFNMEQLVIMCLVVLPGPLTALQIFQSILKTFVYYSDLACDFFFHNGLSRLLSDQDRDGYDTIHKFRSVFQSFTAPLIGVLDPSTKDFRALFQSEQKWRVDLGEARIYLRSVFQKINQQKQFRLMDLPAELRVCIFEYAFGLPKSGVRVVFQNRSEADSLSKLRAMTRDYDRPFSLRLWNLTPEKELLQFPHIQTVLALLQVSKKVHKEALPIFYEQTKFDLGDIAALHSFLTLLPIDRRQCVKKIAFTYSSKHTTLAPETLRLLRDTTALQHLEMHVDSSDWVVNIKNGQRMEADLTKLPGLPVLRNIAAMDSVKSIALQGQCDALRPLLEKKEEATEKQEEEKKKIDGK